jgi:hypothetical protein
MDVLKFALSQKLLINELIDMSIFAITKLAIIFYINLIIKLHNNT